MLRKQLLMIKQSEKVIYFWMSLAMVTWALAWTNAKIVNEYLSFYNLIFLRFFLGFVSLLPFVLFLKNKFPKFRDLKYIIIPSILFLIYNIAFFKGTHYGLAGKGGILVTTLNPLVTVIIMTIINKNILKQEMIGVLVGVIGGIIIMNLHNDGIKGLLDPGNIYFIICALTWGIMTVTINYAQKIINPYIFICICYLFTMFLSLPLIDTENLLNANLDFRFYLNFFFVSMGAMSFGTSVYMYYTPILGPSRASIFIFSVPFLAIGLANFFLQEPFTVNIIIGGILSLLAIYIVNRK